jgi:uncharacterized membrane protein YbhN (UPF0104 family)
VVWWGAHQDAPRLPSGPREIWALAGAVAVYAVATVLRAERWRWLLVRNGADAGRGDCYGLTLVGFMGNNVLPARAGDVMRVVLLAPRARIDRATVVGTLVAERILDVVTLLTLFVVLAYGVLRGVDAPGGGRLALGLGALALAGAAAIAIIRWGRRHPWGAKAEALLRQVLVATRDLRGRYGAGMAALTLALWICEAGMWYFVGIAANVDMSPVEALYLVALASVFVLIPSGPGYAGTLDAAAIFGIKAIGRSNAVALTYLVLLRFVLLVPITVIGLIVLVVRYGGWSGGRAARTEVSSA